MKKETSIQKKLLIQKYGSKLVEFAVLRTDTCRCLVIYVAVWDNVNISMIGSQIHRKESCLKSLFRMSGLLSNISVVGVIEDFWAESKKKTWRKHEVIMCVQDNQCKEWLQCRGWKWWHWLCRQGTLPGGYWSNPETRPKLRQLNINPSEFSSL